MNKLGCNNIVIPQYIIIDIIAMSILIRIILILIHLLVYNLQLIEKHQKVTDWKKRY